MDIEKLQDLEKDARGLGEWMEKNAPDHVLKTFKGVMEMSEGLLGACYEYEAIIRELRQGRHESE